jgi:hypothetical protein
LAFLLLLAMDPVALSNNTGPPVTTVTRSDVAAVVVGTLQLDGESSGRRLGLRLDLCATNDPSTGTVQDLIASARYPWDR